MARMVKTYNTVNPKCKHWLVLWPLLLLKPIQLFCEMSIGQETILTPKLYQKEWNPRSPLCQGILSSVLIFLFEFKKIHIFILISSFIAMFLLRVFIFIFCGLTSYNSSFSQFVYEGNFYEPCKSFDSEMSNCLEDILAKFKTRIF